MAERVTRVLFIDTSILCNLIEVPGRDQHKEEVQRRPSRMPASAKKRGPAQMAPMSTSRSLAARTRAMSRGSWE